MPTTGEKKFKKRGKTTKKDARAARLCFSVANPHPRKKHRPRRRNSIARLTLALANNSLNPNFHNSKFHRNNIMARTETETNILALAA